MAKLNKKNAQEEVETLRKKLNTWAGQYYIQDAPSAEGAVYDQSYQKLVELEKQLPELVIPNSITQRVGREIKSDSGEAEHQVPMLSMGDVSSRDELLKFDQRIQKLVGGSIAYNAKLKIDGLSLLPEYVGGRLVQASTCGSDRIGEDVTKNMQYVDDIPKVLPEELTTEAHGECYIGKAAFLKLDTERDENGGAIFANPRDAVAGGLRQLDPKVTKKRNLSTFTYTWVNPPKEITSQHQAIQQMSKLGLHTNEAGRKLVNLNEVFAYTDEYTSKRDSLSHRMDGTVSKADDLIL